MAPSNYSSVLNIITIVLTESLVIHKLFHNSYKRELNVNWVGVMNSGKSLVDVQRNLNTESIAMLFKDGV